ncbi:MAG: stage III sporulation protein AD [Peptococcaceae bacterium]|nr:stage III sporulation protein AD [Peptococcaceae bacterium]MBQ2369000.1 stage III sporulation protein AD [Peptococcaceae bacterium]MBQ2431668.1 stage III sporulation protein AD [Peptococcaceae bacterium]
MNIIQLLGCGFLTLVVYLVLQEYKSNTAIFVVTAFGILVLVQSTEYLQQIIDTLLAVCVQAGVRIAYFTVIIKMIGIAWLAEFLCQICRDAGSGALAVKLEFAAKISILMMFFPILTELLHSIIAIL